MSSSREGAVLVVITFLLVVLIYSSVAKFDALSKPVVVNSQCHYWKWKTTGGELRDGKTCCYTMYDTKTHDYGTECIDCYDEAGGIGWACGASYKASGGLSHTPPVSSAGPPPPPPPSNALPPSTTCPDGSSPDANGNCPSSTSTTNPNTIQQQPTTGGHHHKGSNLLGGGQELTAKKGGNNNDNSPTPPPCPTDNSPIPPNCTLKPKF